MKNHPVMASKLLKLIRKAGIRRWEKAQSAKEERHEAGGRRTGGASLGMAPPKSMEAMRPNGSDFGTALKRKAPGSRLSLKRGLYAKPRQSRVRRSVL